MGKLTLKTCENCRNEQVAGWIETDNNGPIVPCPCCNNKSRFEREYDRAVEARALSSSQVKPCQS